MDQNEEHLRDNLERKKKQIIEYINSKVSALRAKGISVNNSEIDMYIKRFQDSSFDISSIKKELDNIFKEENFKDNKQSIYDNGSLIPDSNNVLIGCSWNYQLVDFFDFYVELNQNTDISDDERYRLFNEKRDKYLKEHSAIYSDMNKLTYLEFERIYLNLKKNYSYITPSEEFKMCNIIDGDAQIFDENGHLNDGIYNLEKLNSIHQFAYNNNLEVRASLSLVDKYISNNLKKEILDVFYNDPNKARGMLIEFLESYFKMLGSNYNCLEWDIVSDVIYKDDDLESDNGILAKCFLRDILGDDYFIEILKIAKDNIPRNVRVGYTEGNEEDSITRERIIEIINKIKEYELENDILLLDFIGISGHYNDKLSDGEIERIYKDFASLGKDIELCDFCVLQLHDNDINQRRVFKSAMYFAAIYNVYFINLLGVDDKLIDDGYKGSSMFDDDGKPKDMFNDFLSLFGGNVNSIEYDLSLGNVISLMGKAVGAYMTYELIHLLNKLDDKNISYDEKMEALDEYKKFLLENSGSLNLGNCCLDDLDYDDLLKLISNLSNNLTTLSIRDFSKSFDESIKSSDIVSSNDYNMDADICNYIRKNDLSVDIGNLFGDDFRYPKNFDSCLESIYSREDRLLTQKEKNDVLVKMVRDYLSSITDELRKNDIRLDSVVVLNNILEEYGSFRWWSQNFGDDYYVTLFQIVNQELADDVRLSWNEDSIVEDDNRRDEFLSCVERVIQHDPFLISYIGSDIVIDGAFDVKKYDDFVSDINSFCKRMMDDYGTYIRFKISNLYVKNVNGTSMFNLVKHVLDSVASKYFVGVNIGNLLMFNSFSFIDGLGNKALHGYSHDTRELFDLLSYDMDYNMDGSILENNIIGILQRNHDKKLKGIISCNNSFPDTFVSNSTVATRSQDFLQIGDSARHIVKVTQNITSTFPKTISVIQEATSMGCMSPVEYLNVVPVLYEARVIKHNINSIENPLDKGKVLVRKINPGINNIGFSSYLTLTFIVIVFTIMFVLCLLYYM